jgi:hypothetical protein
MAEVKACRLGGGPDGFVARTESKSTPEVSSRAIRVPAPGKYDAPTLKTFTGEPGPTVMVPVGTLKVGDTIRLAGQGGTAEPPAVVDTTEPVQVDISIEHPPGPATLELRDIVHPLPLPALPSPVVRTFEDEDAPAWVLELVDRIAADDATPEEANLYRRWSRGEDVEP